jgi:glutathione S-transferase
VSRAPVLRIFSYLPNPRLAKATIAARLCGVEVEVRGAAPRELGGWLWDFHARALAPGESPAGTARSARTGFAGTLHKTDAFLAAHPFGTVPAAFSPDGKTGIFESNSILRAVARVSGDPAGLYVLGDPYAASRIDSFLDASLVFARDAQVYLLKLAGGKLKPPTHERAREARDAWLGGIEQALAPDRAFVCGDSLTLADIAFAAELALASAERVHRKVLEEASLPALFGEALRESFPRALAHFDQLCADPAFAPDLGPYLAKLARA